MGQVNESEYFLTSCLGKNKPSILLYRKMDKENQSTFLTDKMIAHYLNGHYDCLTTTKTVSLVIKLHQ